MAELLSRNPGRLIVAVADMKVGTGPEGTITTHGLGSCIGLTVYDPVNHVGGMLHYMLAQARDKDEAAAKPASNVRLRIASPWLLEPNQSVRVMAKRKERSEKYS